MKPQEQGRNLTQPEPGAIKSSGTLLIDEWLRASPEFSAAIRQSESRRVRRLLFTIRQAAKHGDYRAAEWLPERRFPEKSGKTRRRALVPSQGGKPVVGDHIEAICSVLNPESPDR